ncbi:MAG: hypothetical protein R3F58_07455 [Steroidobacteraceae bacterium]|nr:hypothetical protein [Steroidobacteraceae bacterium]
MTEHNLWVFVHILLFVYWLGGDLGVLLLARAATQAKLSFAERAFALKMALLIDVTPRICFAVMFPVGLQICRTGGFIEVQTVWLIVSWLVAIAWIVLLLATGKQQGTPLGATLNRIHLLFQAVMLLIVGALGLWSLLGEGPFLGGWLAAKVLLFGLIFSMGIGIDYAFRPVGPAFMRLATEGSKPDIEAAIGRGVNGAIAYVLGLYALLVIIAFLGVTKPF